MVGTEKYKGKFIYTCGACGFGYEKKEDARQCENFCTAHNACSLEITKKAIKKGIS
jgi:hypothetical protein